MSSMEAPAISTRHGAHRQVTPWRAMAWSLIVSGMYVGLVLGIHARNPRTLVSTHGLLHAAVAEQCRLNSLPPENPFYAGEKICYYWFFQACAAALARAAGTDMLHAMEWIIAGSLVLLTSAGVALGAWLYGSVAAGLLIGFLALVGANPSGPLNYLIRSFTESHNVFHNDPRTIFGPYIYWSQVGERLFGPNLPYFLHVTSRPIALALMLVLVALVHRAFSVQLMCASAEASTRTSAQWPSLVLLTATACLMTAINPLIGLASGLSMAAAVLLTTRWMQRQRRWGGIIPSGLPFAAALVLGLAVAVPTFSNMLQTSQGGIRPALTSMDGVKHLAAVVIGAGPVGWLLLRGLRLDLSKRPAAAPIVAAAFTFTCLFTALAACFLLCSAMAASLPEGNEHNLFNAALPLMAVGAIGGLHRAGDGNERILRRRMLLAALLVMPHACLLVYSYTNRAEINLKLDRGQILRLPLDSDLSKMYQWVRDETPQDAVFVTDPREKVAVQGNVPEFPAMTQRILFVGSRGYLTDPYPDAERRREMAIALVEGAGLNDDDAALLQALGRPLYIVHHNTTAEIQSRKHFDIAAPAFSSGPITVYRWEGARP